ncbi:MAG: DUF1127 domain-containing protein [Minwuia sp.]|nr:DUF1127 domain-containing protein [Minwuia sp.]
MSQTYTETQVEQPRLSRTPNISFFSKVLRTVNLLNVWEKRLAERQHLSRLDDRMLQDMGLDRADLRHEIEKPFWRG